MHVGYRLKITVLIIGFCCANISLVAAKMIDRVAVVVNNEVITESNISQMLKTIKNNTDPSELPDDQTLRHQVIERLITDHLILQHNEKNKITITDADVSKAITNIAKQNNISVNTLISHLAKTGISLKEYRQRIRNEMMIEEIKMNEVKRRISITPQEVEALAKMMATKSIHNDEINLVHILVAVPEPATTSQIRTAQAKANKIVEQLKQGEKFARLAATYSNDDSTLSGDHLGWRRINELPTLFEKKLMTAHKNDIIGPIQSPVGFHILEVNDVRRKDKDPITVLEVNARHILIKTTLISNDQQAKQKLTDLRQQILSGHITFEAAAKQYSEDTATKNKGGQLGWNIPNSYDDSFRTALLKLKKGTISQPIKSAYGWHLIQLLDTRKEDRTNLVQKNEAYKMIFNRKFNQESQVWIQELKADAYINILDK